MVSKIWPRYRHFIVFTLVVVFLLVCFVFFPQKGKKADQFPERLGSLYRIEILRDEDAPQLFPSLYVPAAQPSQWSVGRYGSSDGFATIWRLAYSSTEKANEELEILQQMIGKGETRYSQLKKFEYHKKNIYLFLGSAKAHYVFTTESILYWIEVDVPIAQATLVQFINFVTNQ